MRRILLAILLITGAIASLEALAALPWTVEPRQLTADWWVGRTPDADQVLLDPHSIESMNARLLATEKSMQSLDSLPTGLPGNEIRERIERLAQLPDQRFDSRGKPLGSAARRRLFRTLALNAIPHVVTPLFALVTTRADLRALPAIDRLTSKPIDQDHNHDLDRLQESALFPGEAVAAVHASRDGRWRFVISERYAAWVETSALAFGDRREVIDFTRRTPALFVHGAEANTVFDPVAGDSRRLEMGARLPWLDTWPNDVPVSGQLPLAHHVVQWPTRGAHGILELTPVLVAHNEAVGTGPLPYTRAVLLRQGFRFLGERYGWGHDFDGRDCSGFVSEVYRSVGIVLPRNTGDQAAATVFRRHPLPASTSRAERLAHLRTLAPGDLLFLPGHVMMFAGFIGDDPWVLHDAHMVRVADADGSLRLLPINGVAITPLSPLLGEDGQSLLDKLTVSQRILPSP